MPVRRQQKLGHFPISEWNKTLIGGVPFLCSLNCEIEPLSESKVIRDLVIGRGD